MLHKKTAEATCLMSIGSSHKRVLHSAIPALFFTLYVCELPNVLVYLNLKCICMYWSRNKR